MVYGHFNEEAQAVWDFVRCQRSDGSVYGTGGTCRLGTKIGDKKEPLTGAALEDAVKEMMREGIYSPEEWAKGTGYVLRNKRGDIKAFNKASEEAKAIVEAEKKRKRAEERRRPITEEEKKQKEEAKAKREESRRQKEEAKKQNVGGELLLVVW